MIGKSGFVKSRVELRAQPLPAPCVRALNTFGHFSCPADHEEMCPGLQPDGTCLATIAAQGHLEFEIDPRDGSWRIV